MLSSFCFLLFVGFLLLTLLIQCSDDDDVVSILLFFIFIRSLLLLLLPGDYIIIHYVLLIYINTAFEYFCPSSFRFSFFSEKTIIIIIPQGSVENEKKKKTPN